MSGSDRVEKIGRVILHVLLWTTACVVLLMFLAACAVVMIGLISVLL